ncbi:ABC transporter ATP-binding protein Uup [Photobacterium aphoticum]|nr:ABC transporter ATP-binding protein Uup [Photobacterium aphoticum]
MKILGGELEQSAGTVSKDPNERMAKLGQDQFAFEQYTVVDTVIMGHKELWKIKEERDRIYAMPDMSEEDGMRVADLEVEFAEMDGYSAEARAGELLLGLGIPEDLHFGLMSAVAPGLKVRVLLAQVLFADPDIMLLDEPTNNLDIHTIAWLERVLLERNCTMIIISHDRHFLNSVCTHMADLDYGALRLFPGNYDEYMMAAEAARERLLADNAKKKAQMAELQTFVSRFSANASKAKQATSRQKQLDKIQLEEVKASSRQNPFIRFDQEKELFRNALEVEGLKQGYGDNILINNVKLLVEVGERIAIIGENGIGKSTLLNTLAGQMDPMDGMIKWSENSNIGFYAQDHSADFDTDMNLLDWMGQWKKEGDDEQVVRGILGRMLFSQNDIKKSVQVLSGGEQGRMLFGKLIMQRPNILLMDEPTNHMDMESIESLNLALENYKGTLLFVSHDRQFVSSIATRIIEITKDGVEDFHGTYDEYLAKKGMEG